MNPTGPDWSCEPLTPTAFLERAASVYRDRLAVVDGERRFTYGTLRERCRRVAGALCRSNTDGPVAVLSPNSHVLLEAHYGVPWAGRPLVALNFRLSVPELGYIVDHSGSRVLIYDAQLRNTAFAIAEQSASTLELIEAGGSNDEYEQWLSTADDSSCPVVDEYGVLALNYTSGTTAKPKGVMYHHRGAYLQSLAMVIHAGLQSDSVMLWTLPMFHCNGWCFTWALSAVGGVHVCLRKFDPLEAWHAIHAHKVTHLNGAPTVLSTLAYAPSAQALPPGRSLHVCTGGAPPSPTLLARMQDLGIEVTHLYGLTETFGPAVVCEWQQQWNEADQPTQASLKARQGVGNVVSSAVRVIDDDGKDVAVDGVARGEIVIRGNNVMLGYYNDPDETSRSIAGGWFRTGDIGVMHPDGYVELVDRAKDVIISGGENISSVEVEKAFSSHPAVLEVAVVGHPDEKWGEVPVAYVCLRGDDTVGEQDLLQHARANLAHFKVPRRVVFTQLPKTSTGKIQKYLLREEARGGC